MIAIGLTGSIGMGKSTTANLFRQGGLPVHDSDAAVRRLYRGEAARFVEASFPGVVRHGEVNRKDLAARVLHDPDAMKTLEAIVHPLVESDRKSFLIEQKRRGVRMTVFDIPLLFEAALDQEMDLVVVVNAPESVQKARVMERKGMTEALFASIVAKQAPNGLKMRRAHWIIDTGSGLDSAARQVQAFLSATAGMQGGI